MHADLQQIMLCVIGILLDTNANGFCSRTEWRYGTEWSPTLGPGIHQCDNLQEEMKPNEPECTCIGQ